MEQDQKTYALVAAAKQGDSNAFTELYNSAYQMVYHTCFGYLKNREDAEDTTQEVFIYIYNKLSELEDNYAFYGWAKIIAVHTSLNKIKAKRDNISYDDAIGSEEVLEGDDNLEMLPDTYVLRDEKRKIVMGIMEKELSEVQYQTLFMYYYNDLKIEQIAQIMEVSEGTVKTRLKSAKIKVKQGITDYENKTGDRLAINGAIPSLAMLFKASTNSIPVSYVPFAGFGAFGAAGSMAASGVARATGSILNAGGKAAGNIMNGTGGASAGGQIPGQMPGRVPGQMPRMNPQVPGAQPRVPGVNPPTPAPGVNPPAPGVNPPAPAPGVQHPVTNPGANPARNAAKKTASGAAKKAAGKGIVTKVVAGVVAIGVIGGGTVGIVKLINSKKDEPSETKRKKDSVETTRVESVETVPASPAEPTPEAVVPVELNIEPGDVITLGNYKGVDLTWRVLEEKDGNYLVITEWLIDHPGVNVAWDMTWGTSEVRTWLGGEFMNGTFDADTISRIQETTLVTQNEDYQQDPVREETTVDKIFILDIAELYAHLDGEKSKECYQYYDGRENDRDYYTIRGNYLEVYPSGYVDVGYYYDDNVSCVRPAMWINLEGMDVNVTHGVYPAR